jgi:hypothetical protein
VRNLSAEAKLLFLYFITNPYAHVSGIYYIPSTLIATETGLSVGVCDSLYHTLSPVLAVDRDRSIFWVKNMFRHQVKGEKAYRAAASHLGELHNSFLIKEFLVKYPAVSQYYDEPLYDGQVIASNVDEVRNRWNAIAGVRPCKEVAGLLRKRILKLRHDKPAAWWELFFAEVANSKFLTGQVAPTNGKPRFQADLDWATRDVNIGKIMSGKYSCERQQQPTVPPPPPKNDPIGRGQWSKTYGDPRKHGYE